MEKKVYERIQTLLRKKRISANELAKTIGISSTNVYGYLNGSSKAPMSFVVSVLESFPDVSAEWLLRGEGEMLLPPKKSTYQEMAEKLHAPLLASEENHRMYDDLMTAILDIRHDQEEQRNQIQQLAQIIQQS